MEPLRVIQITNNHPDFYPLVGPFLSRRAIVREIGGTIWDDDGKIWHIAAREDMAVAVSAIQINQQQATLKSAYVVPDARRQGIYQRLLQARLDYARQIGVQCVVTTANSAARSLLERAGFRVQKTKGGFCSMRKDIP